MAPQKEKIIKQINALNYKAKVLQASVADDVRFGWTAEALANLKLEAKACLEGAAKLQARHSIADADLKPASVNSGQIAGIRFDVPEPLKQNMRQIWFENVCLSVGMIVDVRILTIDRMHGNCCQVVGNDVDSALAIDTLTELCAKLVLFFDTLKKNYADLKKWEYASGFAAACLLTAAIEREKREAAESVLIAKQLVAHAETALTRINGLALRENKLAIIDKVLEDIARPAPKKVWSAASESYVQGFHDGQHKDAARVV